MKHRTTNIEKNPKTWMNSYLLERYMSLAIVEMEIKEAIVECKKEIDRRIKKGWKVRLEDFPDIDILGLLLKK